MKLRKPCQFQPNTYGASLIPFCPRHLLFRPAMDAPCCAWLEILAPLRFCVVEMAQHVDSIKQNKVMQAVAKESRRVYCA